jgi:maltose alpha-D-glucosyltransferase/alpha-amylase
MARYWSYRARAAFLRGYRSTIGEPYVAEDRDAMVTLFDAWTVYKASYEVDYELNARPGWAAIPLRGIVDILDGADGPSAAG